MSSNKETKVKKSKLLQHWQAVSIYLTIYDFIAVNLAYFLALWLRFDCHYAEIPEVWLYLFVRFAPFYGVFCVIIFWVMKLYQSIWRFASYNELSRVTVASLFTSVCHIVAMTIVIKCMPTTYDSLGMAIQRMPITYYTFGMIIQLMLVLGIRFSYRFILLERDRMRASSGDYPIQNVMIIGAGDAGQMILRDITHQRRTGDKVCCIIDDNKNKWNRYIDGVPIVGGRDDILVNVKKYNINKIYVAIPSLSRADKKEILNICSEADCTLKDLPSLSQLARGEVTVKEMRDVAIEDLLGRETVKVNMEEILQSLSGKTIMVTGGGGSIGSELCRQIANHKPKKLIIFDVYENNAYDIQQELKIKCPDLDLVTLIGSVRDSKRIFSVFEKYKPDIVYHAAAHKHVPLMEASPCEAIKNNVIGTYKTAYAAMMNGCKRFVLISTDKAVNPTNVMGASKRMCEMVVQTFDRLIKNGQTDKIPALYLHAFDEDMKLATNEAPDIKTEFVAVRFGNVLGSNGSVIPLFKKQILAGGPVTVTHPDIIRYFMTIPEAVSLVLQAGSYAHGGEIFVLDMGEPMKIVTLARNLIKLSGFKPDEDIKIEYTGLRPGEKLYEEKLMDEEKMGKTPNQLIYIGAPLEFEIDKFITDIQNIMVQSYNNDEDSLRTAIKSIVTTYHPEANA